MKSARRFLLPILALLLLASCGGKEAHGPQVSLQQMQGCSKIYTSEYEVSKVVFQRDQINVMGFRLPGGERVAVIPVKGRVKAYVDLEQLEEKNVHRQGESIEVVLPDPKIEITATEIAAKGVREKVGVFQSNFSDREITRLQQQGRDSIIAEIPRLGLIADARESAARTLIALLMSMGYEESKVRITFATEDRYMLTPKKIKEMLIP